MPLTTTAQKYNPSPKGGGEFNMAGVIRTYQTCPKCGEPFPSSKGDFPIICAPCRTQPTKYLIKVYWNGTSYDISLDREGKGMHHWQHASNTLGNIRSEIQAGIFDPQIYRKQSATSFDVFWQRFQRKYRNSPSTYDKLDAIYRHHLTGLTRFHLRDIRAFHIDEWWEGLKDKCLSPHYMNDILQWLKRFFNEAQELDIIDKAPHFPKALDEPERDLEWFTQKEQALVFNEIPKHDRPIFDFLFLTGCRVNEVTALQRHQIDWQHGRTLINQTVRRDGSLGPTKAKKTRPIIHSQEVETCLRNALRLSGLQGYVFVNRWGRRYSADYLRDTFKAACERAGVKAIPLKNATRHSFGMRLLGSGMDIWSVSQYMGHADIKMTERYVEMVMKDGEKVYSRGGENGFLQKETSGS